jgi:wyosine [tRNA(Phe)-imidazoG37] synthetase (radical SAM superfamily)
MAPSPPKLSIHDHSRDSAGMIYVYPVVSRRAGGVSIGINLNPNNACNWRCIYCQVPNLIRGGPPPIDLVQLEHELETMLDAIVAGSFMKDRVPEGQRKLIDVAFSGNGEPTSAAEFPQAVAIAIRVLARRSLLPSVRLRLITNGSLIDRRAVKEGLRLMAEAGGEVWFKVDAADAAGIAAINGVRIRPDTMARRLAECAALCPTWVQTCMFSIDGKTPSDRHVAELTAFLKHFRSKIQGIHLYGLARQSAQTEAPRLQALPVEWLERFAATLRETGLTVDVSP